MVFVLMTGDFYMFGLQQEPWLIRWQFGTVRSLFWLRLNIV